MTQLILPHTLDIYATANDGSLTLRQASVAGYFEPIPFGARVHLSAIGSNPLARLWLPLSLQSAAMEGAQIYWHERNSWWTLRGLPEIHDGSGLSAGHIEALLMANAGDTLFGGSIPRLPLAMTFGQAAGITAVKVEVATVQDFSALALSANTATSIAGWLYASGSVWYAVPSGGLPSTPTLTLAYAPAAALPPAPYFTRWTPYVGAAPQPSIITTQS